MASEESKLLIFNAAKALFCSRGYEGTSIRDIASMANVNHAIIRYHYGSKEELWMVVVQKLIEEGVELRIQHPFDPDFSNNASLIKSIRSFLRVRVAHYAKNPEFIKLIYLNNIEGGERFLKMDTLLRQAYLGTTDIVEKMTATGALKRLNFTDLYFLLPAFVGGRFIFPNCDIDLDGMKVEFEEMIDRHTDMVMSFLVKDD